MHMGSELREVRFCREPAHGAQREVERAWRPRHRAAGQADMVRAAGPSRVPGEHEQVGPGAGIPTWVERPWVTLPPDTPSLLRAATSRQVS